MQLQIIRATTEIFCDVTVSAQFPTSIVYRHDLAISPRVSREFCWKFRPSKEGAVRPSREGAGKTGCALHPRSRVQTVKKGAHEHTGSAEAVRPSLRNGFTAYFVLSLATGFFVTIAARKL
ncbi:MAG: hypothetical protein ABI192_07485, partial [Bradyrhizobium sp.]